MLVVTKLDRLARSVADLIATMQPLDRKNMGLRVLNLGEATVYRILAAAKATESG
ncbi:recombinase [Pandoraea horticolens]|uniref:Recombinase n=1 Tax=Pandoraea horticolens TaxID=2508298 RepID=A0A5E4YS89_9BURK|nr:recombinase [Pandoraea horticolens]